LFYVIVNFIGHRIFDIFANNPTLFCGWAVMFKLNKSVLQGCVIVLQIYKYDVPARNLPREFNFQKLYLLYQDRVLGNCLSTGQFINAEDYTEKWDFYYRNR